jgi:hypothetical protein
MLYRVIPPASRRDQEGKLKECKFLTPAGQRQAVFIPPGVAEHLTATPEAPLVLTEGPVKALAAAIQGIHVVGLNGLWGFTAGTDAIGNSIDEMHPDLTLLAKGRTVVFVGDSDLEDKKHRKRSTLKLLMRKLHDQVMRAGAKNVRYVILPAAANGVKQGLDDALVNMGANKVRELLVGAKEYPPAKKVGNAVVADDPLPARILNILTDSNISGPVKIVRIVNETLGELERRGRFFAEDEEETHGGSFHFDRANMKLLRVGSDMFQSRLAGLTGINRANIIFTAVMRAVEDRAIMAEKIRPERFTALREGAVYISCGESRVVKITANGAELVDNGTDGVLFEASGSLKPWSLAKPENPFDRCAVFRNAKFKNKHHRLLFIAWMLSTIMTCDSKPPLVIVGVYRSGKTTLVVAFMHMLGFIAPSGEDLASMKDDDFWVRVDAGGIVVLDNVDTVVKWFANALQIASTGAGSRTKRMLYKDREIVRLTARAWLAITSTNPTFAEDAGLADRLLVVRLDSREDDTCGDEMLNAEVRLHRDAGLSFVADIWHRVLADSEPVEDSVNRRHPGWGEIAVKIGRALGQEREMIAALGSAETDKAMINIENNPLGQALVDLLSEPGCRFDGTAAELLNKLQGVSSTIAPPRWSAQRVGKKLDAGRIHLSKVFDISSEKKGGKATRLSIIRRGFGAEDQLGPSLKTPVEHDGMTVEGQFYINSPSGPYMGVLENQGVNRHTIIPSETGPSAPDFPATDFYDTTTGPASEKDLVPIPSIDPNRYV